MRKREFSNEEIESILKRFDSGESLESLQKSFHTRKIRDILISNERVIKRGGVRENSGRKYQYNFDADYFQEINTRDKAYWLGFIYADGCIMKNKRGQDILQIGLAETEPLEKFKKYLKCNKPIHQHQTTNSYNDTISTAYNFTINSNKIVSDLEKWGVVERKSLILTFPTFLSQELLFHFIRGYFDGDGCVYIQQKGNHKYVLSEICGTKEFLEVLQSHLTFLHKNHIYKENRRATNCWKLKLACENTIKMYHLLYKECDDLYLSRKKEKFENYIFKKEEGSTTIITNPTTITEG